MYVSNFTDEIDNFFGSVLLFFKGWQFFLCFDESFQIITSAVKTKDLSGCMFQFYFMVCNLLLLLLILHGAQRMKKLTFHMFTFAMVYSIAKTKIQISQLLIFPFPTITWMELVSYSDEKSIWLHVRILIYFQ